MPFRARSGQSQVVLVAGGAGFLGSHLCERLIDEGYRVHCIDSLYTGRLENLRGLLRASLYLCRRMSVPCGTCQSSESQLACAASPPHYQQDPLYTVTTSTVGTLRLLEMAEAGVPVYFRLPPARSMAIPRNIHREKATSAASTRSGHAPVTTRQACRRDALFRLSPPGPRRFRVARIFSTYGPRMRLG